MVQCWFYKSIIKISRIINKVPSPLLLLICRQNVNADSVKLIQLCNIVYLGSQSREECEYILNLPFNPAGSYLVRFSHRKQKFILSGEVFDWLSRDSNKRYSTLEKK